MKQSALDRTERITQMAGGINKVFLVGRLGKDPEHRATAGGTPVSTFSLATDRFRKQNGNLEKETEWHRVVAYGKPAECCNQYLHKGRLVCVEGSLETRTWENQGQKHFITEVVAARVTFLDSKGNGGGNPAPAASEDSDEPF
jgi:single-strand DNA-binding protein